MNPYTMVRVPVQKTSEPVMVVALPLSSYRFITEYDPDRERFASRADMVDVLREIQEMIEESLV